MGVGLEWRQNGRGRGQEVQEARVGNTRVPPQRTLLARLETQDFVLLRQEVTGGLCQGSDMSGGNRSLLH